MNYRTWKSHRCGPRKNTVIVGGARHHQPTCLETARHTAGYEGLQNTCRTEPREVRRPWEDPEKITGRVGQSAVTLRPRRWATGTRAPKLADPEHPDGCCARLVPVDSRGASVGCGAGMWESGSTWGEDVRGGDGRKGDGAGEGRDLESGGKCGRGDRRRGLQELIVRGDAFLKSEVSV